ncbi:MAG: autotransporter-associated beta strand repeat-containing protein [Thermoguttaceae bacterium]|nr:autotransporter-associated beta strand repeat-containing protein [Thermoguttaceae bacterium]
MAKRTFAIVTVFAAFLSVTLSVQADFDYSTMEWTGNSNSNFYTGSENGTTSNWKDADGNLCLTRFINGLGAAIADPSNALFTQNCYIYNSYNKTITMDWSDMGVASLTVGDGTSTNTTATVQRSGTLTVKTNLTVQTGGAFTVNNLNFNSYNSVNGTLTVSGGSFTSNNSISITNGVLNLTSGTLETGTLTIGNNGTFTQTNGSMTATSTISMNNGTFTQTGGTFSATGLTLGGGTMSATTISLNSGNGTFTQNGGTLSSYGNALTISGSYVNSGGQIAYKGKLEVANSVTLNTLDGSTFDFSSFIATPNQKITLVESTNDSITITSGYDPANPPVYNNWEYHLENNGTKLTATYLGGDGRYYWNGSEGGDNLYSTTINWSEDPDFGNYSPENNCYILSTSETVNIDRSDLGVTSLTVGSGSLTESGAAIASSSSLEVETALTINKGGTATFNGALSITKYNSAPGTLTVNGGTVTANSTTGVSGALNITDGSFNAAGAVTVTNGGAVSVTGGELTSSAALSVNNGGGLTVHGGTVNAQNATNVAGTLTITSGTYNASGETNVNNGGTLTVTSGTYNATDETTVNAGGTLTVNGGLFVTNNSTEVSGNLNVSAGSLNSSDNVIVNNGGAVSISGSGKYNVHNTTLNAGGSLSFPNSEWKNGLTINGGTVSYGTTGSLSNNGTITYSSGTLNLSCSTFRIGDRGIGVLNINGGELTIAKPVYLGVGGAGETPSSGTINQTSGKVKFSNVLYLGWGAWSGTYNLSGDGVLTTSAAAGLWNANSSGVSTFNVSGGQANFSSFDIGLHDSTGDNEVKNVFNLYSGEVNTTGTFTVRKTGILNVAKTAQNAGGDGVFNANAIEINTKGVLNLSSGTINLGSGGITSSGGTYTINLSGGTFGTKAGDTGNGWSTSLTANIASGTTVTFAPAADKTITWNGALTSSGGVTKTGAGTLELTAANTYSGVTTISTGTLKLSGSGTLAGNIVDNGTLEFAHTADLTGDNALTNAISGTGTVTKTGSGTLELKGSNTYSGGTTISAGTLKLSNNNLPGTGNVTLENNGILEFANNDALTFSKIISGTGSVTKSGSGVLHVSGANTYSGGTKISSGGAIRLINDNATLGTGPITLDATTADLRFAGDVALTVSNKISGPGGIIKQGENSATVTVTLSGDLSDFTGKLTTNGASNNKRGSTIKLSGANANLRNASEVVIDGTLDVTEYTGSTTMQLNKLSGAGIVNIGSKPIILNNAANANTTFNGAINGSGAVTKIGPGTLTLTQAPAYTGSTTIKAGTLELPGNSTLHNLSGGTLGDNGQIAVQANLVVDGKLTLDNNAMSKFIGSISATSIEKTGNGTLKLYSAAANMISAESLVISSGRVDIKEYFKGQIEVKSGGTISPGNSVGTLEIVPLGEETYGGGFILNEAGSELLMEIGGETPDKNDKLIVDGPLSIGSGIIYLALADENTLTTGDSFEAQIIAGNESTDYLNAITKAIVPGWPFTNVTVTKSGNVYSIRGIYNPNAVPEPSTWALLILGAAGMLYWRKKKNA